MKSKKKVVILYRVIQEWRRPIFEYLSQIDEIDLTVYHGPDFEGTKVINTKKTCLFKKKELWSFKIKKKISNGQIAMPFSPLLFFTLIKEKPDIIICEGASNLINNIFAFLYKFIFNKKVVWWSLGEIPDRKKSTIRKLLDSSIKFMETKSDAIISYSNQGKNYFEKIGIPTEKIFVAVNVVDTKNKKKLLLKYDQNKIYKEAHIDSKINLLFVGALTKEKKLDILLKAFALLEQEFHDIQLTIVGSGNYEKVLFDLADSLNLEKIYFTGKVFDGVEKYFLESDLFVLPGLGGLAISEAMVYNLPVIASIADGCEKDLVTPKNGIIDENLNSKSLYEYIKKIYLDPQILIGMKKESRYIIDYKYNIETYIENIHKCIKYLDKVEE